MCSREKAIERRMEIKLTRDTALTVSPSNFQMTRMRTMKPSKTYETEDTIRYRLFLNVKYSGYIIIRNKTAAITMMVSYFEPLEPYATYPKILIPSLKSTGCRGTTSPSSTCIRRPSKFANNSSICSSCHVPASTGAIKF